MEPDELKKRRAALGLNQTELAALLGINHMTVWRYENEKLPIPVMVDLALQTIERTHKPKASKATKK